MATALLTALAMLAFAGNSLLNRLALHDAQIDAASFVAIRIVCGALTLAALAGARRGRAVLGHGSWAAAALLVAYAALFSLAYLVLPAGTGALILFGAVQVTMLGVALRDGERFGPPGWAGFALASAGLVYLLLPGIAAPAPWAAVAMALAGVAWGAYSLLGRGATAPLAANAGNFVRAVPLALVALARMPLAASALVPPDGAALHAHATTRGVSLAAASSALTSGLGYAIWYAALRRLTTLRAATVQLSVPLIAAGGGVLLLAEPVTPRLALACVAILGGIGLVLSGRAHRGSGPGAR